MLTCCIISIKSNWAMRSTSIETICTKKRVIKLQISVVAFSLSKIKTSIGSPPATECVGCRGIGRNRRYWTRSICDNRLWRRVHWRSPLSTLTTRRRLPPDLGASFRFVARFCTFSEKQTRQLCSRKDHAVKRLLNSNSTLCTCRIDDFSTSKHY